MDHKIFISVLFRKAFQIYQSLVFKAFQIHLSQRTLEYNIGDYNLQMEFLLESVHATESIL